MSSSNDLVAPNSSGSGGNSAEGSKWALFGAFEGPQALQRKFLELKKQFSFRSVVAEPIFGEARLAKWGPGWERVKDIYRLEQTCEWRLLKMAFFTGFGVGYFFGGATSYAESMRRFDVYVAGKIYLDRPHNQLRSRRLNYTILRFNIKGCKVGLKLGLGLLSIVALTVVPVAFRGRFSLLNLPLATMLVFGANASFRGWGAVGWHGSVPPAIMANVAPMLLLLCYCLYHSCGPNEAYWRIKKMYELELFTKREIRRELDAYTRANDKSQFFRFMPWARAEIEHERKLGTWLWTSAVEDGLANLEKAPEEGEDQADGVGAGDDQMIDEEEKELLRALERKRRRAAWWRFWDLSD